MDDAFRHFIDTITHSAAQPGQDSPPTLDARDVWTRLEVETPFEAWITSATQDDGFIEGQDYLGITTDGLTEYYLTPSMATQLAMLQPTPQGRAVRLALLAKEAALPQLSKERQAHQEEQERLLLLGALLSPFVDMYPWEDMLAWEDDTQDMPEELYTPQLRATAQLLVAAVPPADLAYWDERFRLARLAFTALEAAWHAHTQQPGPEEAPGHSSTTPRA